MFPMRGNPRQLRNIMRQLGLHIEELRGVVEVTIKLEDNTIIRFVKPSVTIMKSREGETFLITGKYEASREGPKEEFSEEDIKIVMEKANVDREKAIEALKKSEGNLAEAIMMILSGEI